MKIILDLIHSLDSLIVLQQEEYDRALPYLTPEKRDEYNYIGDWLLCFHHYLYGLSINGFSSQFSDVYETTEDVLWGLDYYLRKQKSVAYNFILSKTLTFNREVSNGSFDLLEDWGEPVKDDDFYFLSNLPKFKTEIKLLHNKIFHYHKYSDRFSQNVGTFRLNLIESLLNDRQKISDYRPYLEIWCMEARYLYNRVTYDLNYQKLLKKYKIPASVSDKVNLFKVPCPHYTNESIIKKLNISSEEQDKYRFYAKQPKKD